MRAAGHRLTSFVSVSVIQAFGFTSLSLQLSTSEAMQAQLSAPSSLPAFHDVGVDLDATVVEEAAETLPVVQAVADRIGEGRALRDDGELLLEPAFQPVDERPCSLLADGAA